MLKKFKNFICKLLGIKQCACSEDEHVEPEPDMPVLVQPKPTHCGLHNRFRINCPACAAIIT
jgi:hypothetical protein